MPDADEHRGLPALLLAWSILPAGKRRVLLAGAVALGKGRAADFDRILVGARAGRSDPGNDSSPSA